MLSSCVGQQSVPTNYYVLAYLPAEDSPRFEEAIFDSPVSILDPSIDPVFDRRQVVRRISATRLRYLSSDLWAVTLPDAFQRAVREAVGHSGAFPGVYSVSRDVQTRYRVAVVVDAVELIDPAGEADRDRATGEPKQGSRVPVVHLELQLQLIDGATSAAVSRHRVSYREPLGGSRDIASFVDQLSRVLSRSVDELLIAASDTGSGNGE